MDIIKRLAAKNRAADPKRAERSLARLVVAKIRTRYSTDEELAVLRQRDTKPGEFAEYNAFAEQCKAEAKAELGIQ